MVEQIAASAQQTSEFGVADVGRAVISVAGVETRGEARAPVRFAHAPLARRLHRFHPHVPTVCKTRAVGRVPRPADDLRKYCPGSLTGIE